MGLDMIERLTLFSKQVITLLCQSATCVAISSVSSAFHIFKNYW